MIIVAEVSQGTRPVWLYPVHDDTIDLQKPINPYSDLVKLHVGVSAMRVGDNPLEVGTSLSSHLCNNRSVSDISLCMLWLADYL